MASNNLYPLPTAIEDITPAWVDAALRSRNPGVRLNDAEILDVNHGTCTKIRLRLDVDAAGKAAGIPERVILKGGFEPHSREMHYMMQHEVRAYGEMAPIVPMRMPASYFAGYEEATLQGIVIMEDLVARGVTFLHAQRPRHPDEIAERLSVLAKFHAMTWGKPDFEPGARFDWAGSAIDSFDYYATNLLTAEVWQSYVDSSRGAAVSARFQDLDWVRASLAKMVRFSRMLPNVLLHGDTHLGNLYLDTDGAPGFYDVQVHYGPVMNEIAYHLTCALDIPDRREHERRLVEHYRQELIAAGVDAPSLDEFMFQYGCHLVIGHTVFMVNASAFQPEAINTAYTARFSAAMLDHDTMGLLATLP